MSKRTIQILALFMFCAMLAHASPLPPGPVCKAKFKVVSCRAETWQHPLYGASKVKLCALEVLETPELIETGYDGQGCPFVQGGQVDPVFLSGKPGTIIEGSLQWGGDEGGAGYSFSAGPVKKYADMFKQEDRDLVERYLRAEPPPCCDQGEPYSEEVAAKPYLAALLAEMLQSSSPQVQEKRSNIIFMLGRMGNPRAFQALMALYDAAAADSSKIRLMTSLGACVTSVTLEQYLDIVVNDPAVLAWLQKQTGSACTADQGCWKAYFSDWKNLKKFTDRCRQLSQPILG